jgi:hypothetical protein
MMGKMIIQPKEELTTESPRAAPGGETKLGAKGSVNPGMAA